MTKKTAKKKNVLVEDNKTEKFLTKVFGDPQKKVLRRLQKKVNEINALSEKYKEMTDEELKNKFDNLTLEVREEDKKTDAFC